MAANVGDDGILTPISNASRRVAALRRKIKRQHRWRAQVWADCELRIRQMQTQLELHESPPQEIDHFDFTDEATLVSLAKSGDEDESDD